MTPAEAMIEFAKGLLRPHPSASYRRLWAASAPSESFPEAWEARPAEGSGESEEGPSEASPGEGS